MSVINIRWRIGVESSKNKLGCVGPLEARKVIFSQGYIWSKPGAWCRKVNLEIKFHQYLWKKDQQLSPSQFLLLYLPKDLPEPTLHKGSLGLTLWYDAGEVCLVISWGVGFLVQKLIPSPPQCDDNLEPLVWAPGRKVGGYSRLWRICFLLPVLYCLPFSQLSEGSHMVLLSSSSLIFLMSPTLGFMESSQNWEGLSRSSSQTCSFYKQVNWSPEKGSDSSWTVNVPISWKSDVL